MQVLRVTRGIGLCCALGLVAIAIFFAGARLTIAQVSTGQRGMVKSGPSGIPLLNPDVSRNVINTLAGSGTPGFSGDGGPASAASLNGPHAIAVDGLGNIFVADTYNSVIRQVSPSGVITSIAGFFAATDIAADFQGNLFIADPGDNIVLELTATAIFIIAGNQTAGFAGDGGPATSASLNQPTGVALDYAGNLYIADSANNRVRMVNTAGVITTVAGTPYPGFSGDGGPANTARLNNPVDVGIDLSGDLYIVDQSNQRIRKVDSSGIISTVVGNGSGGFGAGDGLPATSTSLNFPSSIAFDPSGTLYFADTSDTRIRKVGTDGTVQTVAGAAPAPSGIGDGGPATSARLALPWGITFDLDGNLLIADTGNHRIRKVSDPNSPSPMPLRAISPSAALRGTIQGGWIAGLNLAGATAVTFSGTGVAAAILQGGSQTWLPVSISVAGNAQLGDRTVSVMTPSGMLGPIGGFRVVDGNAIRVESISIPAEPQGTTFQASISGRGLTGATSVMFSGTGVTAAIMSGGKDTYVPVTITIAPTAPVGARTITLSTPNGSSDAFNAFVVIQPRLNPINTVVGNGNPAFGGDGGPATSASINGPQGMAIDNAGNLFIADFDNNRIRKVTPAGVITTVAGTGVRGFGGDGGPATSALLSNPTDIAVDSLGNLFIADLYNYRVRKVTTNGVIQTVAGSGGDPGFGGDGGLAILAQLKSPSGVSIDTKGNLYIADTYNNRIRMVNPLGIISTVAGGGTGGDGVPATSASLNNPSRVSVDQTGNLYIAESNKIRKVDTAGKITTFAGNDTSDYAGDGGPATLAQFHFITGVAADTAGNVFIADSFNHRVRMVDSAGLVITVAGAGTNGFSGDAGSATSAQLSYPMGVAVDGSGNLFIADNGNNRVRRVPAAVPGSLPVITGISPFIGDRGSSLSATITGTGLGGVTAVTLAGTGVTAVISGAVTATSLPVTINISADAAAGPRPFIITTDTGASALFNSFTIRNPIPAPALALITPSSGAAGTTIAATISGVNLTGATAVDFSGNGITAVVGNGGNDTSIPAILTIAPDAAPGTRDMKVTTPVGASPNFPGFTVVSAGTAGVITTIAGNGTSLFVPGSDPITSNSLFSPWKAVLDSAGNLVIADRANQRIRKLSSGGVWSIVAGTGSRGYGGDNGSATSAMFDDPRGIAVDNAGNIFIADSYNARVRRVDINGVITTVAGSGSYGFGGDGGPAKSAKLAFPTGVAMDSNGNLFIADQQNNRIRKVNPAGIMSTVAGTGVGSFSGDGGPATSATLQLPADIAVDTFGNLFIADSSNNRIREVTSDGLISTIAGSDPAGFAGDGGPAVAARLYGPQGVAVDPAGDVFIADTNNQRVRRVTPDGVITTVAGSGFLGSFGGDGGPGTSAALNTPIGLFVDSLGNLLIADSYNNRVRKLTFLPTIASISPSSAAPGGTVPAIIRGTGLIGTTGVAFTGNGVTVAIGAARTAVSLAVTISIAPDALAGVRSFIVSRSDGSSAIFKGFLVNKKGKSQLTSQ